MGEYFTGAVVTKQADLYCVEYKHQIVAEFELLDLAVIFAMDSVGLERALQRSNIFNLKAAK